MDNKPLAKHFPTIAERLVPAIVEVRTSTAREAREVAFMARMMVLATLPHRDPGDVKEYARQNGDYRLVIQPGPGVGIPFGSYPRLMLAWITTEALRTRSRRLVLGASFSLFMREAGVVNQSGGANGTNTRFRDQMKRLFSARVSAIYDANESFQLRSFGVADEVDLWWSPKDGDQASLWESTVVLGERFFEEIITRAIPLDIRVLKAIKQSALALDLYMWLTYRVSRLKSPLVLSWDALHEQFGADYSEVKHFAAEARRELRKIKLFWPELDYTVLRGRLMLKPCGPHIPRLETVDKEAQGGSS